MTKVAPLKILIVDDHAAVRRTVRQMVEAHHVVILEASSGEEAVARFAAEHPDWAIMDVRMPGMGGIKATEAIRKLDPQAPISKVLNSFSLMPWIPSENTSEDLKSQGSWDDTESFWGR